MQTDGPTDRLSREARALGGQPVAFAIPAFGAPEARPLPSPRGFTHRAPSSGLGACPALCLRLSVEWVRFILSADRGVHSS